MPINTAGLDAMLTNLGSLITHVALYTNDLATTEVTGGTYARQTVTWNAASGGTRTASNTPVFSVPSGATVAAIGLMSAVTGGTQYAYYDAANESYGADGTYTVTSITLSLT